MGIVINQSIKSSIIGYIGVAVGAFNILWLYPRYLKPEEFGLIRLLQDIPFLFALFVQLGASGIVDKYFFHFKDGGEKNSFLPLLLLYPLIGFTLFLFSFFFFYSYWTSLFEAKSGLLLDYFIYLIPLTLFMMYTSIMEAYLRANLNVYWSNFVRDVFIRILYTSFIFIYAFKLISFDILILLIVVGYGLSLISLVIYAKKINILRVTTKVILPPKPLIKEIGTYLLFLIPGTAGSLIAQKIDTIMLGAMGGISVNDGLQSVAIYSLAYFIGSVIEVPRKSISQISIPLLSSAFKENDLKQVQLLYIKNSIVQFIIGSFLFLLIWINIDDLFNFIPNADLYRQGKFVIFFIGISKLFDMATSINGEIIQFSTYYKFNLIAIVLLSFLTIGFNLIFIPLYSVTGAAIGLAITIMFYNFSKTIFIWYKLSLLPFSKEMFPILIICIITLSYSLLISQQQHSLNESLYWIFIRSTVFTLLFYIIVRKLKLSSDINSVLDNFFTKFNLPWIKKNL